jgi:hypothetical protein
MSMGRSQSRRKESFDILVFIKPRVEPFATGDYIGQLAKR